MSEWIELGSNNLGTTLFIAIAVTIAGGPVIIPWLRRLKWGQFIRPEGPTAHYSKAGTPTMGGLLFLLGITVAVALSGRNFTSAWVVTGAALAFGLIGFLDDMIKVVYKRSLGLKARQKLAGQFIAAAVVVAIALLFLGRGTELIVPYASHLGLSDVHLQLGAFVYFVFALLVIVGTANAVNLTDGLDGLAAGVTFIAALALAYLAAGSGERGVALALVALAGGCAGFLFYNRHPARVFMGDTGSLALGGALGAAAVLARLELFLFLVGGVYVIETLSVVLQVLSFRLRGKRIFRMSPLHHHFELGGWSEKRVVRFFYLWGLIFALLGLGGR